MGPAQVGTAIVGYCLRGLNGGAGRTVRHGRGEGATGPTAEPIISTTDFIDTI